MMKTVAIIEQQVRIIEINDSEGSLRIELE
jgi:hypothetical protein